MTVQVHRHLRRRKGFEIPPGRSTHITRDDAARLLREIGPVPGVKYALYGSLTAREFSEHDIDIVARGDRQAMTDRLETMGLDFMGSKYVEIIGHNNRMAYRPVDGWRWNDIPVDVFWIDMEVA